jgi:hypothetical protein
VSEILASEDEEGIFQRLHDRALKKGIYLDVSRDRKSPNDWFVRGIYAMSRNPVYSVGSGSQVLRTLFDCADKHVKIIRLEPWTSGKRKLGEDWFDRQRKLITFCTKLGFVVDPERDGLLVRHPKQEKIN